MKILRNIVLFLLFTPTVMKAQNPNLQEQKDVYNTIVLIGNAWTQNDFDTLEKYIHKDYAHTDTRANFK
jgi:hypothetical protein